MHDHACGAEAAAPGLLIAPAGPRVVAEGRGSRETPLCCSGRRAPPRTPQLLRELAACYRHPKHPGRRLLARARTCPEADTELMPQMTKYAPWQPFISHQCSCAELSWWCLQPPDRHPAHAPQAAAGRRRGVRRCCNPGGSFRQRGGAHPGARMEHVVRKKTGVLPDPA
jgi:hypothetical protein